MMLAPTFIVPFEYSIIEALVCILYMLPLKKRGRGIWPVVGATVLAVAMRFTYTLLSGFGANGMDGAFSVWLGNVLVAYVSMALNIYLACDVGLADTLYCMVWADLTQNLLMSLFRLLSTSYQALAGGWNEAGFTEWIALAVLLAVTSPVCYRLVARGLPEKGAYRVSTLQVFEALLIDVPAFFFVNLDIIFPSTDSNELFQFRGILLRLIVDLCALSLLYLQLGQGRRRRLEHSLHQLEDTLDQQYRQYLLSRDTIDLINRKCHDLKHQITALESGMDGSARRTALAELKESIRTYDTFCHTGSEVLDTVLTDKALTCQEKGITLTCVADGSALSFLTPMDLCTIFGNALDNAIESVEQLPDPEKRLIHLTVFTEKGLAMLRFENYFEGSISLEDGLPATTKGHNGYHGFGLKSIRYTAERYGGTATVQVRENWFELRVLMPRPVDG